MGQGEGVGKEVGGGAGGRGGGQVFGRRRWDLVARAWVWRVLSFCCSFYEYSLFMRHT